MLLSAGTAVPVRCWNDVTLPCSLQGAVTTSDPVGECAVNQGGTPLTLLKGHHRRGLQLLLTLQIGLGLFVMQCTLLLVGRTPFVATRL